MTHELEWLVEVDQSDKYVSQVNRSVAHRQDRLRLHREVMVLLYKDNLKSSFWLQKRSKNKIQYPGKWTLSATGHVEYKDINAIDKDGYLTAAKREVQEELGIYVPNLKLMGKIVYKDEINWAVMGIVIGEYPNRLKINLDEVREVRDFTRDTLISLSDKLTPGATECLKYLKLM